MELWMHFSFELSVILLKKIQNDKNKKYYIFNKTRRQRRTSNSEWCLRTTEARQTSLHIFLISYHSAKALEYSTNSTSKKRPEFTGSDTTWLLAYWVNKKADANKCSASDR